MMLNCISLYHTHTLQYLASLFSFFLISKLYIEESTRGTLTHIQGMTKMVDAL